MTERHRKTRRSRVSLLSAAGALAIGCSGPYDATVHGVVTLDGQPLPSGTVSFFPKQEGPTAYSRIDDSGEYTIRTGRENGLPSGDYQVTVVAREKAVMQQSETGGPPKPGRQLTPNRYRNRDQSGLEFTVEPGANQIDLELSSGE